ncbi:D-glycero-beta-D-manno-heptose-7-phosphate kinase [Acidithiobacillus ferrooxidans]|uniref:D-glycero-beta-D-manno-heptose-7-phosphate kinase n=1 Tax=Acidithiobacillus ferrooxidans TaxID=920 RepID=UPI001EF37BD2|nr:D-glycero-beta-D-manno-heptose-7-phosphate kinase [Acidithiobacillus ferrooxidans]MCR2829214.1 D-glycero-beta-D-manno-heptose-7-phosphate kinase [Acidithiobacillus ferrooxidans]
MPSDAPDMVGDLHSLARAQVAIVGDVMLDRYWFGKVERISPEAPVPVVQVRREEERPGGAANVALNVLALGAQARLLAPVGDDGAGERLGTLLTEAGVKTVLIPDKACPTTVKLRVIGHQQQLLRMDFEAQPSQAHSDALRQQAPALLINAKALLLSDYGKGALREVEHLVALGRRLGIPVLIDPKGRDYRPYQGATIITPNLGEFQAVAGTWANEAQFRALGEQWRVSLQLEALLVTRGEEGMTLFMENAIHHHPAQAREVFDVTGAGDTVIATLATALAAGWAMDRAVELANRAAGIVVGKLGAAVVTVEELAATESMGEG